MLRIVLSTTTGGRSPSYVVSGMDCGANPLQIEGRVEVAVLRMPTRTANKHSFAQTERSFFRATGRAGLGTGKESVGEYDARSLLGGYVLQLQDEVAETQIMHLSSPHPRHALEIEVF